MFSRLLVLRGVGWGWGGERGEKTVDVILLWFPPLLPCVVVVVVVVVHFFSFYFFFTLFSPRLALPSRRPDATSGRTKLLLLFTHDVVLSFFPSFLLFLLPTSSSPLCFSLGFIFW